MTKILQTDKRILFELDQDARRSVKKIAKKLHMNRDTVAYRIKQLEKKKIITHYYTLIDASKLGYILVRLYLKLQNTNEDVEQEIISDLMNRKYNLTVYRTEGSWEIATGFQVPSIKAFNDSYRKFQEKYRRYILEDNVSVFYEFVQYLKNYLVPEESRNYESFVTETAEKINYDKIDFRILKLISDNSKIQLLDIANKMKMTSMAIKYRLKQLEKKKVILGYRALIDHTKLGYEYYKVDMQIEDSTKLKKLQEYCKQHPNIIYENKVIGGFDFEFDIEIESYEKFYKLIETMKKRFPGLIRTHKFYKARKIYKYVYMPEE